MITYDVYVITDPCGDEHRLREIHVCECPKEALSFVYLGLLRLGYSKSQIIVWKFGNTDDCVFDNVKRYKVPITNEQKF